MLQAAESRLRSRSATFLTLVPTRLNTMGGRPKYLERRGIPAEVFHLLEALEKAAEAVGTSLLEAAKVPTWRDELHRSVARLTSLLLVRGESGGPSVVARIAALEERFARLEATQAHPVERMDTGRKGGGR